MRRRGPLLLIVLALGAVLALSYDTLLAPLVHGLLRSGADDRPGTDAAPSADSAREAAGEHGGPRLLAADRPLRDPAALEAEEQARRAAEAARAAALLPGQVEFGGVLKDASGRGVGGARLLLAGDAGGSHLVRTNDEGAFAVGVLPGRYDLLVSVPGRGALYLEDYVVDGLARLDLELALAPPVRLALVVERQGRGVEGVPASLSLTRWRWEGESPERDASTDRDGRAAFTDLVPGTYQLVASVPDGPLLRQTLEVEKDAEVRVSIPDGVELAGLVTDAATKAGVPGASVTVVTGQGKGPALEVSGLTGPDGRYRLLVPRGAVQAFRVGAAGFAPYPHPRDAGKVLGSLKGLAQGTGPVERDAALTAGGAVSGRVLQQATQVPLPGIMLVFKPRRGAAVRAISGEDGRYAVPNLNAGDHEVSVETAGWYPPQPVSVRVPPPGGEPVVLDVALAGARSLTGVVVLAEGAPVSGARVWLTGGGQTVRSARGAGRPLETFTSQSGRFTLSDVPPGLTVVVRAALGPLEALPTIVAADKPPPEVRLTLAATVVLTGRVLEQGSGQVLANVRVRLKPVGAPWGREGAERRSGADGRFRFERLIPGEFEVRYDRGDYLAAAPRTLALGPEDDETRIELLLDPGLVLAGLVTDAEGRVIAGATVRADGTSPDLAQPVRRGAAVGADGRFRLTGFVRGTYRLRVDAPGHRSQALEGLGGGEERLRIALKAVPSGS